MKREKSFVLNTAILFVAMFLTKGLGAVLKIPLGNILGGEGMGYYTTAYSIFTPVLAFSCSGIPTIVTRATAQNISLKRYKDVSRLRRCALILALAVGLVGTALIYIVSVPFVSVIANSPESLFSVLLIAPAVLFCSVTAVYRGYYEGMSDALPTAISQVLEALVKAGLGIGLSYYVYIKGTEYFGSAEKALPYAAAAAILGVSVSELCGTVFMLIRGRRKSDSLSEYYEKMTLSDVYDISKDIFLKSLPVAIGAAVSNIISFIDMLTVANCINLSNNIFGISSGLNHLSANISDMGNFMYGSYSGIVMSVYMLAGGASAIVARCALPRLTCAVEINNMNTLKSNIELLIKGTAFISAPIGFFMATLSEPLLSLLYTLRPDEVSVSVLPLAVLSTGTLFSGLLGAVCVIYNAYGDFIYPIKLTLVSGAVKLILNVTLIIVPEINITGAALATVLSNVVILIPAILSVKRKTGTAFSIIRLSFPYVLSALVSSFAMLFAYSRLENAASLIVSILVSCAVGCVSYLLILFIVDGKDLISVMKCIKRGKQPADSCNC